MSGCRDLCQVERSLIEMPGPQIRVVTVQSVATRRAWYD